MPIAEGTWGHWSTSLSSSSKMMRLTAISTNHKYSGHLMPMSRLQELSPSVLFSFHVIVRTFWSLVMTIFNLEWVSKAILCAAFRFPLISVQLYMFQNRNLFAICNHKGYFARTCAAKSTSGHEIVAQNCTCLHRKILSSHARRPPSDSLP